MATLTSDQVQDLDPYAFLAVLGKRVIHPGGRASTDRPWNWPPAARATRSWTSAAVSAPRRSVWRRSTRPRWSPPTSPR